MMIMKKKYLLFVFASFLSFAQNTQDFSIVWNTNKSFIVGDTKYNIPQFQSENFEFQVAKNTISYVNILKVSGLISESTVTINNIIYETIDVSLLGDLGVSNISSKIDFKAFSSYARDDAFLSFQFNPIIKDNSGYKRVKSFTLNYSVSNAKRTSQSNNSIQN